jgi:hypothetical protein
MIRRPWPSGRNASTAAASAAAVLLASVVFASTAWASPSRGSRSGVEQFTGTVTWGAAPSPTSVSWGLGSNLHQHLTVSGTGTVAITAVTYKVVVSNALLSGATYTLAACTVAWSGSNTCQGGAGTAIGTTYALGSTTTVTSTVVPGAGGSIYLQATASTTGLTTVTMTITVSVSATQTRAPVVTQQ